MTELLQSAPLVARQETLMLVTPSHKQGQQHCSFAALANGKMLSNIFTSFEIYVISKT